MVTTLAPVVAGARKVRTSPRCGIVVEDLLPSRWDFLRMQNGLERTWTSLLENIDVVAETANDLMGANGLSAARAVDQAIADQIRQEREDHYTTGYYWNLTPKHRDAIVAWLGESASG